MAMELLCIEIIIRNMVVLNKKSTNKPASFELETSEQWR